MAVSGWPSWEQRHYTAGTIAFLANIGVLETISWASDLEGEAQMGLIAVPFVLAGLKLLALGIDLGSTRRYNAQVRRRLPLDIYRPAVMKLGLFSTIRGDGSDLEIGAHVSTRRFLATLGYHLAGYTQQFVHQDYYLQTHDVAYRDEPLSAFLAFKAPCWGPHALVMGAEIETATERRRWYDFPDGYYLEYWPDQPGSEPFLTDTKTGRYYSLSPHLGLEVNEFNRFNLEIGMEYRLKQWSGIDVEWGTGGSALNLFLTLDVFLFRKY